LRAFLDYSIFLDFPPHKLIRASIQQNFHIFPWNIRSINKSSIAKRITPNIPIFTSYEKTDFPSVNYWRKYFPSSRRISGGLFPSIFEKQRGKFIIKTRGKIMRKLLNVSAIFFIGFGKLLKSFLFHFNYFWIFVFKYLIINFN
jgi:hypothetical protein